MSKGKICGQYVTSILGNREVTRLGYDEALLLDAYGHVCEGAGENAFMVKRGVLWTPPTSASILAGTTRDSVMRMARDQGIEVVERLFSRDELWCADEVFLTGTAAEITPVREVDDRVIGTGEPGPITRRLQEIFFETVRGETTPYPEWLHFV